jgi:hypothetical protein
MASKSGLQFREYRNSIKGALLSWFARKPLINRMIMRTLNQRLHRSDLALGCGNPLALKIRTAARRAARWLGDELELWPLSFRRLLARHILARLDEVGPCLQRLAASRDHLAVPV